MHPWASWQAPEDHPLDHHHQARHQQQQQQQQQHAWSSDQQAVSEYYAPVSAAAAPSSWQGMHAAVPMHTLQDWRSTEGALAADTQLYAHLPSYTQPSSSAYNHQGSEAWNGIIPDTLASVNRQHPNMHTQTEAAPLAGAQLHGAVQPHGATTSGHAALYGPESLGQHYGGPDPSATVRQQAAAAAAALTAPVVPVVPAGYPQDQKHQGHQQQHLHHQQHQQQQQDQHSLHQSSQHQHQEQQHLHQPGQQHPQQQEQQHLQHHLQHQDEQYLKHQQFQHYPQHQQPQYGHTGSFAPGAALGGYDPHDLGQRMAGDSQMYGGNQSLHGRDAPAFQHQGAGAKRQADSSLDGAGQRRSLWAGSGDKPRGKVGPLSSSGGRGGGPWWGAGGHDAQMPPPPMMRPGRGDGGRGPGGPVRAAAGRGGGGIGFRKPEVGPASLKARKQVVKEGGKAAQPKKIMPLVTVEPLPPMRCAPVPIFGFNPPQPVPDSVTPPSCVEEMAK